MIVDAHTHIFGELHGQIAAGPVTALGYGRVRAGDEVIQMLPLRCVRVSDPALAADRRSPRGVNMRPPVAGVARSGDRPTTATTTFPAEALIANMDWAGVTSAVLLQGPFYGDQNLAVSEAVRQYRRRFVGAAFFDPWEADNRKTLDDLLARGSFRAVKLECSVPTGLCGLHPEARLDAPEIAWLWNELESLGLVLVADLGAVGSRSYQTDAVRAIAEAHPRLKIVIPHLGQIRPAVVAHSDLLRQWHAQIDLGRLPNVWFDSASLVAYCADEGYPYPGATEFLRRAFDRVDAHKILWGSDVPGLLAQVNYRQLVDLGIIHSRFLNPEEQDLFLHGNASQVYGLGVTTR